MSVVIQSVSRALQILDVLARHPQGLGVAEVAKQAGLNVSTTHHLLNTLARDHYVGRRPDGGYCLGYAVSRLYGAFVLTQQPDSRLLGILGQLVAETQETCYLAGWADGEVMIQAIEEGSQPLRVGGLRVGYRGHSHARAAGKALLAYRGEAELEQFLARPRFEALTPHTLTDPAVLRAELQQVAAQGYAVDREEFTEGVVCVAAPIFPARGRPLAALSLSAPAGRLRQHQPALIAAVQQAAREASGVLGHAAPTDAPPNGRRPKPGPPA